jgi:hypothetical protein
MERSNWTDAGMMLEGVLIAFALLVGLAYAAGNLTWMWQKLAG